jgi:membrane protein DedA with SNARE-associated domain
MNESKKRIQLLWGAALVVMGIALIFEIPHKMAEYQHLSNPFIKFCLYFIAAALIYGGGKKILNFRKTCDI